MRVNLTRQRGDQIKEIKKIDIIPFFPLSLSLAKSRSCCNSVSIKLTSKYTKDESHAGSAYYWAGKSIRQCHRFSFSLPTKNVIKGKVKIEISSPKSLIFSPGQSRMIRNVDNEMIFPSPYLTNAFVVPHIYIYLNLFLGETSFGFASPCLGSINVVWFLRKKEFWFCFTMARWYQCRMFTMAR